MNLTNHYINVVANANSNHYVNVIGKPSSSHQPLCQCYMYRLIKLIHLTNHCVDVMGNAN